MTGTRLPVLPAGDVAAPADRFRCAAYRCDLTARSCLARQASALDRRPQHPTAGERLYALSCVGCAVGADIAAQVAEHAARVESDREVVLRAVESRAAWVSDVRRWVAREALTREPVAVAAPEPTSPPRRPQVRPAARRVVRREPAVQVHPVRALVDYLARRASR